VGEADQRSMRSSRRARNAATGRLVCTRERFSVSPDTCSSAVLRPTRAPTPVDFARRVLHGGRLRPTHVPWRWPSSDACSAYVPWRWPSSNASSTARDGGRSRCQWRTDEIGPDRFARVRGASVLRGSAARVLAGHLSQVLPFLPARSGVASPPPAVAAACPPAPVTELSLTFKRHASVTCSPKSVTRSPKSVTRPSSQCHSSPETGCQRSTRLLYQ
jgi:hypothetical protein